MVSPCTRVIAGGDTGTGVPSAARASSWNRLGRRGSSSTESTKPPSASSVATAQAEAPELLRLEPGRVEEPAAHRNRALDQRQRQPVQRRAREHQIDVERRAINLQPGDGDAGLGDAPQLLLRLLGGVLELAH